MPITRARKEAIVETLTQRFSTCQSAVFIDYGGLTVHDMERVRAELRGSGSDFLVAKNNLIRIALDRCGMTLTDAGGQSHEELCLGMTAVAFGYEQPNAPAKVLTDLAGSLPMIQLKGGFLGTTPVSGEAGVKRIANMRAKEDALADVVRLMKAAPSRVRMLCAAAPQRLIALKRLLEQEAA